MLVTNGDFPAGTTIQTGGNADWLRTVIAGTPADDDIGVVNNALTFTQGGNTLNGTVASRVYAVWQEVDVDGIDLLDLSVIGTSAAAATGKGSGTVRVGLSTLSHNYTVTNPNKANNALSLIHI